MTAPSWIIAWATGNVPTDSSKGRTRPEFPDE